MRAQEGRMVRGPYWGFTSQVLIGFLQAGILEEASGEGLGRKFIGLC